MTARERYEAVRVRMEGACRESGRSPAQVKLIAVSKTHSAEAITQFIGLGQKSFGENYVQEAIAKQQVLQASLLDWHFIGALQTNKAKQVVGNFSLIHGVDRLELAQKINKAAQEKSLAQSCLIEVNIDQESSKAGVLADQLPDFLKNLQTLPFLQVRGLMCIPAPRAVDARRPFAQMRELLESINKLGVYPRNLTELSMGMSDDFEVAIAEGATMVRIGSALFGAREGQ